jgi:hypothetical protein
MKKVVAVVEKNDTKAEAHAAQLESYHLKPRRASPNEALQMIRDGTVEHVFLQGALVPASRVLPDLERMIAASS